MKHQESFEKFWKKKYSWEISRGVQGRGGFGLKMIDGVYVADRVQFAYEVWVASKESDTNE